jgi:Resolvase, N terminal domain
MLYGYARVLTTDQDLSIQHTALTAAGWTVIRSEKVTGTSTEGREELPTLLQFLREGDTLIAPPAVGASEHRCLADQGAQKVLGGLDPVHQASPFAP